MVEKHVRPEVLVRHGVPVGLIIVITLSLFFIIDPFQLLLPVAALACGYVLRPRHLWVIWLASWVGFVTIFGVMVLLGFEPPKTPEQDLPITLGSFIFSSGIFIIYFGVLAVVPLWVGRYLASRRMQQHPA